ncbi:MAG: ankyrin repeat protein [Motiliproteus sp.]
MLKAIRAGVDLNEPFRLEADETIARSAVEHALRLGHGQCLQKLLEAGALLPERGSDKQLLLGLAINNPTAALSLSTLLLQAGADANANQGEALFACINTEDDNLALLLTNRLQQYGADLNAYTRNGQTLLGQLLMAERRMLVGVLISAGAELPTDLDQLGCSDDLKAFARRKASDIAIQKLFLGS